MTDSSVSYRSKRGSVLLLSFLMGWLVAVILLAIVTVCLLCVSAAKSRSLAEEKSLAMAACLNKGNRLGELNHMIGYSRQLVFSSRQVNNEVLSKYPQLKALSGYLMDDARSGACKVKEEFEIVRDMSFRDVRTLQESCDKSFQGAAFSLPGLEMESPRVEAITLGSLAGMPSNASLPASLQELREHDERSGYKAGASSFYRGSIDARLPLPDNDLSFKFSCLPPCAPGQAQVEQLRLVRFESLESIAKMRSQCSFRREGDKGFAPCAAQLDLGAWVTLAPGCLQHVGFYQQQAASCSSGDSAAGL